MQESAPWNHSFAMLLSYLGSVSYSCPSLVSECTAGEKGGCSSWLMAGILFLPWVPSGLTVRGTVICWLGGCHILCLWGGRQHLPSFPAGAGGKAPTCECRRHKRPGFNPWVRKIPWRRAWPLQCSCLENSMDRGAWQDAVHGVAVSWTRLSDSTHARVLLVFFSHY